MFAECPPRKEFRELPSQKRLRDPLSSSLSCLLLFCYRLVAPWFFNFWMRGCHPSAAGHANILRILPRVDGWHPKGALNLCSSPGLSICCSLGLSHVFALLVSVQLFRVRTRVLLHARISTYARTHEQVHITRRRPRNRFAKARKWGWYGWKPSSSSNFSTRAFRAYPLIEMRQITLYRAIRADGISVNIILPPS